MDLTVLQTSLLLASIVVPRLRPSLLQPQDNKDCIFKVVRIISLVFFTRLFSPPVSCHLIHYNLPGYIALKYTQVYRNQAWEFLPYHLQSLDLLF